MLRGWKIGKTSMKRKNGLIRRLVTLFFINQEASILNVMLEFQNIFIIKGTYIYFGYQNKVYVISKQLIVDVFGVCLEGYVEDPKGQVRKIITSQALQGCRIAPINFARDQWNAKSLGLPYSMRYITIIPMIHQREKVTYFSNKKLIVDVFGVCVEGMQKI